MKSVSYTRNGAAADVLEYRDVALVQAAAGEIRVKLAFSGVNPSDVKRRAGATARLAYERALVNMDGSGIVDAVGEGVDPAWIGARVWLHKTAWERALGTSAEYIVTTPERAFVLPDGVPLAVGAGLGVPAMTAHRAVFGAGPVKGKTVLVTGAAGVVGFYAVQLAKWGGATVFATVSSPEKAALARRAGADAVIDYKQEDVAQTVLDLTGQRGVDHIVEVDFGSNLPATCKMIANNGVIASYASMGTPKPVLPFYDFMWKNVTLMTVLVYAMPEAAIAEAGRDINAWLQTGTAEHNVAQCFPLADMAGAHLAVEAGTIGKVLVEIGGEGLAL